MSHLLLSKRRDWENVAKEAQSHRDSSIARIEPAVPNVSSELPLSVTHIPAQLLSKEEIRITQMTTEQLVSEIAERRLTSTTVTKAFLRRAGLAQKLVNCITEMLPERALARAEFLDEHMAKHGKPIGPLHGIPISVKEHLSIEGLTVTAAFIAFHEQIAPESAHLLKIFEDAGAIFHARTTEPQILMHLETSSNYFGRTVNPFNRNLTAGGSSGGEGALIGLRGSCLGIGTDIGGSIRSPAANQGLYGLRPTSGRVPLEGSFASMIGQDHIIPTAGPISTSLEGIKLFMKVLLDAKPWITEPSLIPIPWKEADTKFPPDRPLHVAILWSDEVVRPHPPITRALREVEERLSKLPNVTVSKWEPYRHDYAWSIIASLYFIDGGAEDLSILEASGEPLLPLTTHMLKNQWTKRLSIEELWEWQIKREQYKSDYAKLWASKGGNRIPGTEERAGAPDIILSPVGPSVAPLHETARYWGYTSQWNLLDYPSLVFPVSKVDPIKDKKEEGYTPLNDKDRYNWELYSPEAYQDAPISLQVTGRRYEDEKVVGITDFIQKALGLPLAKYVPV